MINPSNKKYSIAIYNSSLVSLSHVNLSECEVCINEGGCLPIYTLQVTYLLHDWGWPIALPGPNSPRETANIHSMMLNYGLFPRLTKEVVPQGLDTIKTSRKEENTYLMRVQQHTIIIHIRISFEVTNTSTRSTKSAVKPSKSALRRKY